MKLKHTVKEYSANSGVHLLGGGGGGVDHDYCVRSMVGQRFGLDRKRGAGGHCLQYTHR